MHEDTRRIAKPADLELVLADWRDVNDFYQSFCGALTRLGFNIYNVSDGDRFELVVAKKELDKQALSELLTQWNQKINGQGGFLPGDESGVGDREWRFVSFEDIQGAAESFRAAATGLGLHVYDMPSGETSDSYEYFVTPRALTEDNVKQLAKARYNWGSCT